MDAVGQVENGVLIGKDDQLFLAHGGHHVLEFSNGTRKIPDESFAQFERNITERSSFLKERDMQYLHVIVPDKQSILSDQFPYPDPICLGELYLERCAMLSDQVYYPKAFLQERSKKGDQIYLKTDTHLTDGGSILLAAKIIEKLKFGDHQEFLTSLLNGPKILDEFLGDLGGKLNSKRTEQKATYRLTHKQAWFHNAIEGGNNGLVDIRFSANSKVDGRLLLFGDSFGRILCRFLSIFFFQSVFMITPYFHSEIVEAMQPTVVITQNAERYLDYCNLDEMRPLFFMYPHLSDGRYIPSRVFAEAMSAVCSFGRPPYSNFIGKMGFR